LSRPPLRSFLLLASSFARPSAAAILLAISALSASRLKFAPRCIGGQSSKEGEKSCPRAGWGTGFPWPLYLWTNTKRQNWLSLLTVNYRENLEIFQRDRRPVETRDLIRRMSLADHSGAPRVHGATAQARHRSEPSHGWRVSNLGAPTPPDA
jgi:hypothetical protein